MVTIYSGYSDEEVAQRLFDSFFPSTSRWEDRRAAEEEIKLRLGSAAPMWMALVYDDWLTTSAKSEDDIAESVARTVASIP